MESYSGETGSPVTTVFMTGASGFLGTEVTERLLREPGYRIFALVRGADEREAVHRLKVFWSNEELLTREIGRRILPVAGDFTRPDLGLSRETRDRLAREVDMVFHIGAETGIQKSREELMKVNRDGTEHVLRFAEEIRDRGRMRRFLFISTAYVAGARRGTILETDPLPDVFSTYYEQSKAEAEELVRASGLPFVICRPGMIVGNSRTGRIRNFNTVYYILKLLLQGKLPVIPVSPGQRLNLVPVDYVADCAVRLAGSPEAENRCFHLTCPEEGKPAAKELADQVLAWAARELHVRLRPPLFVPVPALQMAGRSHNRRTGEKQKTPLSNLTALTPYFYDGHIFDRTGTDSLTGPYDYDWRSYLDPMLRWACRCNFLHKTDRNIFEQVLYRLESRSAPITYYDIGKDTVSRTSGKKMRKMILRVRAALAALGVRKGDRVALTGCNCTQYFALDIAIGLAGAVSVPVYYTTPAAEVDLILEKSGAGWFFIGDRRILREAGRLKTDIPLIVFAGAAEPDSNEAEPGSGAADAGSNEAESGSGAADFDSNMGEPGTEGSRKDPAGERTPMRWDQFLAGAKKARRLPKVYVDPDDLATIRYTSGTTGEPKGVMFEAGQLEWMGQILTDLLPWKEKQEEMRYLSFLPLSHVVEGILASCAPYYVHCPVNYYYLNDFDGLTDALPRVRPTVFFSVPRFYEKLWQQIEENPAGRKYLGMKDGPRKRALGRVLKKAVLKRAGLDRCSQLIVGSAPVSEELLLRFRGLGIEIHNAYGQTEAPLITINRMGGNVIPSVGTPLPDTEVTVREDGELVVRGPQVCRGYYGMETDTIADGTLRTGDLGRIDAEGRIFLSGRKKEMVITSYGKNINCPKIENMLRDIPGVSEAVLIGENRPYCTALLWTDAESSSLEEENVSGLGKEIEKVNGRLSHPEQVRKWTVISEPLRIQKGELTPNLKVRRAIVEDHYRDAIREMYE